jgi:hypothetical protein
MVWSKMGNIAFVHYVHALYCGSAVAYVLHADSRGSDSRVRRRSTLVCQMHLSVRGKFTHCVIVLNNILSFS